MRIKDKGKYKGKLFIIKNKLLLKTNIVLFMTRGQDEAHGLMFGKLHAPPTTSITPLNF